MNTKEPIAVVSAPTVGMLVTSPSGHQYVLRSKHDVAESRLTRKMARAKRQLQTRVGVVKVLLNHDEAQAAIVAYLARKRFNAVRDSARAKKANRRAAARFEADRAREIAQFEATGVEP